MTSTSLAKNYDFYADADLTRYAGEWVAIVNEKVVAHRKNVKELIRIAAQKCPGITPFIAKVPLKTYSPKLIRAAG